MCKGSLRRGAGIHPDLILDTRYKMVIVTWLGVFPIVTILFSVFGHWLNLLPTLVRTLVFTAVMVTLMTYVVMPRMTRLFSFWLYPDRRE